MERIIGRKVEIKELTRCLNSNQAEFVAVYGRRRIGKTFLVRELLAEKKISSKKWPKIKESGKTKACWINRNGLCCKRNGLTQQKRQNIHMPHATYIPYSDRRFSTAC